MDDVYENIDEYKPNKKCKIWIVLGDMLSNKKLHPIVTELFIKRRKLNISIVFIIKSYVLYENIFGQILLITLS